MGVGELGDTWMLHCSSILSAYICCGVLRGYLLRPGNFFLNLHLIVLDSRYRFRNNTSLIAAQSSSRHPTI
ncbi:hypothetical protein BJX63DRAFT_328704 [Aspergillus granulosus]|uniref:Uncharacterized protein n=1 Tax=Aspergillus granulosus TaxID=176169 RepID=A0ABR4H4J0_9EURO